MLLHLIQDCSSSHVIDKIELTAGHKIESCLLNAVPTKIASSVSLIDTSAFVVVDEGDNEEVDDSFGRWFVLYMLDWVSINCSTRQIEWCFYGKESSHIKYIEDEEYDIDMDEMFDCTQRLIECISDEAYSATERHESLVQFLHQQVLSLITISQNDLDLIKKAAYTQEKCIRQLDEDLEMWNNAATAYKITLANLQRKLEPDLLKYSHIRSLYPEVTQVLTECLSKEMNKLKRGTVSAEQRKRMEEITRLFKLLRKRKKSVSGSWKRGHSELLEEWDGTSESFLSTDRELKKVRATECWILSAKVKATQIKEYIRNVQETLRSTSETYGYDVPSSSSAHTVLHSHYSLYDSVLTIIQDATQDVGREHALACKWIIEKCKLTEVSWETDPSLIPSATDTMNYDNLDEDFLLVSEPDIFTVILDRISTQSAYTVGQLIKLLPRIKTSPAATKRLILTYETIIYNRIAEYITPLLELRYRSILDQLAEDIRHISWSELDIEDEWIISLLHTQSPSSHLPPLPGNALAMGLNTQHTAPSSGNVQSTTPSGENIQSVTPSGENVQSATPSGENVQSATPSGENVQSATPSGAAIENNAPSGGDIQNNVPSGGDIQNIAPSGGDIQNIAPSGRDIQNTAPSGEGIQSTASSGELIQSTAPICRETQRVSITESPSSSRPSVLLPTNPDALISSGLANVTDPLSINVETVVSSPIVVEGKARSSGYSDSGYYGSRHSPEIVPVDVADVVLDVDHSSEISEKLRNVANLATNQKTDSLLADGLLTNQQTEPDSYVTNQLTVSCFDEPTDSADTPTHSANDAGSIEKSGVGSMLSSPSSTDSKRSSLRLALRYTTLGGSGLEKHVTDSTSEDFRKAIDFHAVTKDEPGGSCGDGNILTNGVAKPATNEQHSDAGDIPISHSNLPKLPSEASRVLKSEIDSLLCQALISLDEKVRKLEADENNAVIPSLVHQFRITSPARLDHPVSVGPAEHTPLSQKKPISKNRSKSVDVKSKGKYKKAENAQFRSMFGSSSRPTTPSTPQSPGPSPRILQIHAQTRKDVESVLLKRRSRRFKSKRLRVSVRQETQTASVVMVGASLFNEFFKESIQCLIDMQLRNSPLEKAQLLAKCLRCMSTTISEIRARKQGPTTSDDLVTVAIVLLLNIPTKEFRSVYIQLKFISTYMNEFMDAGIHNFACIQFIGAMQYIQDQIFTKRQKFQK